MVPEFIIQKVCMQILMVDKSLEFGPIRKRFETLQFVVSEYLNSMESGFVSNNSKEFIDVLEKNVGKVQFVKSFAVRIRPNETARLFMGGKEIFAR